MERRKYIAELVARTGVQVDENDPVFAVVLLNRLILEDQKSELETLVEQLSKTGKAINGEVVKQAQTLWDTKTRQLHAEAAELKAAMLREHAEVLESTRKAIRQEIGEAMGQVGPLDGGNQSLDLVGCACLWRDLRCSGWTGCVSASLSK